MLSNFGVCVVGLNMLIEFSLKNFRSIKDRVTLSMVATSAQEIASTHLIPTNLSFSLLPSAVIYGANAAGKSNVIRGFQQMRNIVAGSSVKTQRGDGFDVTPHLFDAETASAPTEMEVIFIGGDGVRYQYGFSVTEEIVHDEWLFAYPKGRQQTWFSRIYDSETRSKEIKTGPKFLGDQRVISSWINQTRENALFLSTAIQLNNQQLQPVFDWFRFRHVQTATVDAFLQSRFAEKILMTMQSADLGVDGLHVVREEVASQYAIDGLSEDRHGFLAAKTVHRTKEGNEVFLDMTEASQGTKLFFQFIGPWYDALSNGGVVVVDELNGSLHPFLFHYLVAMFNDPEINTGAGQLIFTTHDTTLLDQSKLRRDQVWFVEKRYDNSTDLYPLTEFSPRKGRDNIQQNYLMGRYGALPDLKDIVTGMGEIGGQRQSSS